MECPKCHKTIKDGVDTCPYCHKVLALVCPNCHSLGQRPICEECGYIILTKCAKCGKIVPADKMTCKCGFPVSKSLEINECETDEFASIVINFAGLNNIRRALASKQLYSKFYIKLTNVLKLILKNVEGLVVRYGETYIINMNKELSFATSCAKAIKIALRIINAFVSINRNVVEELNTPLKLTIEIVKKSSDKLLENVVSDNNVKLLTTNKDEKKYLKGMQIILDQYVQDVLSKEYSTDSLYTVDKDSQNITYYEVIISKYVLPPNQRQEEDEPEFKYQNIRNSKNVSVPVPQKFKVFDINAKCKFIQTSTVNFFKNFDNNKLIAIRSDKDIELRTSDLVSYLTKNNQNVISVVCTKETAFRPWGIFEQIFREYFNLSSLSALIDKNFETKTFSAIKAMLYEQPRKAMSPEDARFAYMEDFARFFNQLKNYTIIINGFENIDDTTTQTLSLYFDKFRSIVPQFIFITDKNVAVHSKIKGLLRTNLYSEYTLIPAVPDEVIALINEDANDFFDSFYFEKITDNFNGSSLYFDNAIRFLKEKDVLVAFENKLLIKNNNSVLLPNDLISLLKSRLKHLGKINPSASMILAMSVYLGYRLDFNLLKLLEIEKPQENAKLLEQLGYGYIKENFFYVDNYLIIKEAILVSMKSEVGQYLCKTIFVKICKHLDSVTQALILSKLEMYKEEYLVLWKNSHLAITEGDYDSYLKNSFAFLSLIDKIGDELNPENVEKNKKEVFEYILMSLYGYSPEKIYSIEHILLMDAIKENDDDKIIKLSNLMLQGALISSNYTEALTLLHNILTRMKNPTLLVDEKINSKFLLLSLVHIEILLNIGDYEQANDIALDILSVLRPDILEEIKPAGFSTNLFIGHLIETFTLVAISKIFSLDDDVEEFINNVGIILGIELPDKDCILAIKNALNGEQFIPSNVENATPFSKVIYLILQEFSEHKYNYKEFAQNIYQAKLLASDIHQAQLELLCDTLIAYSYANMEIYEKAESIYDDIIENSKKMGVFSMVVLAGYFKARMKISQNKTDEAFVIINDSLVLIQRYNNYAKLFYALFEKLFIEIAQNNGIENVDVDSEIMKLKMLIPENSFNILMNDFNSTSLIEEEKIQQGEEV